MRNSNMYALSHEESVLDSPDKLINYIQRGLDNGKGVMSVCLMKLAQMLDKTLIGTDGKAYETLKPNFYYPASIRNIRELLMEARIDSGRSRRSRNRV